MILMFSVRPVKVLILSIALTAGCAVNETGLVSVRHFENSAVHMVNKEAWGVYLSTGETDGGLVFGHMKRSLFYLKPQSPMDLKLENLIKTFEQAALRESEKVNMDLLQNQSPIAWASANEGFIVNANAMRIGLILGLESQQAIRLPKDFDGAFRLSYSSNEKPLAGFYRTKLQKTVNE